MKIISPSSDHEAVSYHLPFWFSDHYGSWGYSFECDETGQPLPRKNESAEENYQLCLTGEVRGQKVIRAAVERRVNRWHEYATGLCVCGQEVYLDAFTNTCGCGRDYNMSGQLLAPRDQWGEETGEHWSDCI